MHAIKSTISVQMWIIVCLAVWMAVEQAKSPEKRAESMALLAEYVMRRGNLVEAEKIAREAEALNPDRKRVPWAIIGAVRKEQGQLDEAIAAYEHSNTIEVGHIPSFNRRASAAIYKELAPIYAEIGRLDDALELIHEAERELGVFARVVFGDSSGGGLFRSGRHRSLTCKHHDLDPFAYLQDVLSRLPSLPEGQLDVLLPDVWFTAHPAVRRKTAA
jgi:tetratricopeptide (TPR) repeat protein